jgi:hypothetical protein
MTKAAATIIDACTDEALFAGWFRDLATLTGCPISRRASVGPLW